MLGNHTDVTHKDQTATARGASLTGMTTDRPPRCRPVPPAALQNALATGGTADAELLQRLEDALAALPPAERSAAVVAFGLAEGAPGVADELGLTAEDAEALSRSALQLLRGALAGLDLAEPGVHPSLPKARRRAVDPLD